MGLSIQLQQNLVKDKLGHGQCSVVEMKGESGGCAADVEIGCGAQVKSDGTNTNEPMSACVVMLWCLLGWTWKK